MSITVNEALENVWAKIATRVFLPLLVAALSSLAAYSGNRIMGQFDEYGRSIGDLTGAIHDLRGSISSLIEQNNLRFEVVNTHLTGVDSKLDAFEQRLRTLEMRNSQVIDQAQQQRRR